MHDAIEIQLAHRVGNAASQALLCRTNMMQKWADFIDELRNNIIPFPKRKSR